MSFPNLVIVAFCLTCLLICFLAALHKKQINLPCRDALKVEDAYNI